MMINRRYLNILLVVGACFLALLLYAANLYFGDLNHDEGWYLYAARQVSRGMLPYRDFCFTQPPLVPFIYAFLRPLWEWGGVAGGRLITAFFGLLSALLAAWLAWRLSPPRVRFHAALTCFVLISGNIYQSYFTTIVKTYSLTALFLCAGFLALSFVHERKHVWWASIFGGLFLTCAAGTRISTGIALPIAVCYLIWQRRRVGHPLSWFVFGLGGAAALAGIFLPWFILAPEGFIFGLSLHTARDTGNFLTCLLHKTGFVSRCLRAYYLATILAGVTGMWWWIVRRVAAKPRGEDGRDIGGDPAAYKSPPHFIGLLLGVALLISAVHFMAPFPYDDYQVPVFPLFAVTIAVLFWLTVEKSVIDRRDGSIPETMEKRFGNIQEYLQILILVATVLGAFSSQLNQDWFIIGQDRFWWPKKEKTDIGLLRETAAWIRQTQPVDGVLLTQDTYLAVEAGLRVPCGFEMGPFSYFPKLSTEKAREFKVFNRELMTNLLLTTDAPLAAFSGYGLAISAPEMTRMPEKERALFWEIVKARYELIKTVPYFGQAHTTLTIWRRKAVVSPLESPSEIQ